jgi:hypothetical protein
MKRKNSKEVRKMIPYTEKVKTIQKAILDGRTFLLDTYLGFCIVVGIDEEHAITGEGNHRRSWAICSREIDEWYNKIKERR